MRPLTEQNYADLLSVPLLIKLPHQRGGKTSDRVVNTTDILPTIAAVLGVKIPWQVDGTSVVASNFPQRDLLTVFDPDANILRSFPIKSITALPQLSALTGLFGSRTHLNQLAIRRYGGALLGRDLGEIDIVTVDDLSLEIDQAALLEQPIDLSSGFLPLYLSGRVNTKRKAGLDLYVVVAVNGVIEAVTRTVSSLSSHPEFRLVLPPAALRPGRNDVEVYIRDHNSRDSPRLLSARTATPRYRIGHEERAEKSIIASDGKEIPIVPNQMLGYLEPLKRSGAFIPMVGWAIEKEHRHPASEVLIFVDGRFQDKLEIDHQRQGIADWLGPEYLKSGFYGQIPSMALFGSVVTAYSISREGLLASELKYYYEAPCQGDVRLALDGYYFYQDAVLSEEGEDCESSSSRACIVLPNSKVVPIKRTGLYGRLEAVRDVGDCIAISGWAADVDDSSVPKAILVFQNRNLVYSGYPGVTRPDIARRFGATDLAKPGFDFAIPKGNFSSVPTPGLTNLSAEKIRILALSDRRFAWELDLVAD